MKIHWLKQPHITFTQNNLTLLSIVLFVFIAVVYSYGLLWLPPEYDEVLVSNAALNCSSNVFIEQFFWSKGQCFPIMLSSYIGGFMAFPERIAFLFFGSGLLQLRVMRTFLSIISLLLLYLSAKKIKDKSFAVIFLLLLAFDFQLWSNLRFEGTAVLPFFLKSLVIYLSSTYVETKKKGLLFAIGVSVSLSIWTKFDAVFFYISVLLPAVFVYRDKTRRALSSFQDVLVLLGGVVIGIIPFMYYLTKNSQRFIFVGREVGNNTVFDAFFPKLQSLFFQFSAYDDIWYIFRQSYSPPIFVVALLSIIWIFFFVAFKTKPKEKENTILWSSLLLFLFIFFLYSGLKLPHHRILIYPVPHVLLAVFLYMQKRWVKIAFITVFALVFINSQLYFNYLRNNFEPQAGMSKQIYSLSKQLHGANGRVLVGDWGITNQLLLLSNAQIDLKEIAFVANTDLSWELFTDLQNCEYLVLRHKDKALFTQADTNLRAVVDGNLVYTDPVFEVYTCETK